MWPRLTRSRAPDFRAAGLAGGVWARLATEATTAGASSTTVRCPEVRVEATKRLRVRVDRRLAGPLPGLLCLAGRLA